ncbi:hypothetical protein [Prevotellamassilia timonensis]|uniref:hypothetical protein n=1 Tax=Prevotellamassilia timonensis TaxID=1852370 RepID=UPI00402523D5
MKLTIIKEFHDIEDFSHVFQVGDVVEFNNDRAKEIISLGLGEELHQEGEELHQEERKSSIEVSGKGGKRLTNIED